MSRSDILSAAVALVATGLGYVLGGPVGGTVLLVAGVSGIITWHLMGRQASEPQRLGLGAPGSLEAPAEAPELLVDYFYSDRKASLFGSSQNEDKPLVVRNVTPSRNAYNVTILPLETPDGTAGFEPDVVNCVPGGEQAEFNARFSDGFVLLKNQLINLLERSYKDTSTDEYFGAKSFTICVRYENADGSRRYIADCEITYRKYKNEIRTGRVRIKRT